MQIRSRARGLKRQRDGVKQYCDIYDTDAKEEDDECDIPEITLKEELEEVCKMHASTHNVILSS